MNLTLNQVKIKIIIKINPKKIIVYNFLWLLDKEVFEMKDQFMSSVHLCCCGIFNASSFVIIYE